MVRGMTILWAVLALLAGISLFLLKHDVQTKEDQLARLNRKIKADQTAIHVLQAEWTFLNNPDRLRDLAARHLPDLRPMTSDQVLPMDAIPMRGSASPGRTVLSQSSRAPTTLPAPEYVSARPQR